MKAVLLAAGAGTRLRPLTLDTPKCLVPIRGQPLLAVWLNLCRRHGIREVLINSHWKADRVREFLKDNADELAITLTYEEALLGSGGTIRQNWSWLGDEECFWIFYADVLTNADLTEMLASHKNQCAEFTMGIAPVDEPHRSGIAELNKTGRITSFVERPSRPKGNLAFAGIFLAGSALFDFLPPRMPSDLGRDVFPWLANRMHAYRIPGYVVDVGTLASYRRAQETWPGL